MKKKKKTSTVAENLMDSLMDDLKDIRSDSLIHESDDVSKEYKSAISHSNEFYVSNQENIEKVILSESEDLFSSKPPGKKTQFEDKNGSYQKGPSGLWDLKAGQELESDPFQSGDRSLEIDSTVPLLSAKENFNPPAALKNTTADDQTVAVEGFAKSKPIGAKTPPAAENSYGSNYRKRSQSSPLNVMISVDASLAQAESLRFAQARILDLEKEVEKLRSENEELGTAGEIIQSRADDLTTRISSLEKEKKEIQDSAQNEVIVLKGNLRHKENELAKVRVKADELETRLKSDFKKIRVRERELENRLELLRAEKSALVRSKDEYILDQKRKIDQLSQELDNYRRKCLELNKALEANHDQFKRTERALRLALTNLEVKEESLTPIKKAE